MRIRVPHALVPLILLAACGDPPPPRTRPTTLASHPHALDRLARLMREQFSAADPVTVEREIRCESRRVQVAIQGDFAVRQRFLMDSLRQEYSSEQFNELGLRLGRARLPEGDDPLCRTFAVEAEREAPLAPVTTSVPPDTADR